MKHPSIVLLALLALAQAGFAAPAAAPPDMAPAPFRPEWQSLKRQKVPEWFRDAKFGIYTHWGPVTVASENAPSGFEWYGRQLYEKGSPAFQWHKQHFGDQKTVGYKDVIPHFTAEKFDADAWADLFARAGAKFAGPVAIHHDNFANWDSAVTRWNSMKMGPKRDITGELSKAIRKRGLRFLTTFHHGFAWRYYEPAYEFDAADPQYADLYGEPHKPGAPPSERFLNTWLSLVDEVVTKYQPDMIWFDFELGSVIPDEYRRLMFSHYYNWAARHGKQVGVAHKHREIHRYTGILDFERGREDRLVSYPWLTDTSIGPWFHHNSIGYKSVDELVDVLVDIVSKNGCMLLNVGPQVDGRIPDKAQKILLGIGDWLKVNGEAIYGTRPWVIYGEGPTKAAARGGFSEGKDRPFTASDVRFTTKGKTLFAIALAWPADGKLTIRSLGQPAGAKVGSIRRVELLGSTEKLQWTRTPDALVVSLPAKKPCDCAYALRIAGDNLRPAFVEDETLVKPAADGSLLLEPAAVQTHGAQVQTGEGQGQPYIGWWDNADDWVSWRLQVPAKGTYQVSVTCSAAYAPTDFTLELAGRKSAGHVPKTPSWFDFAVLDMGKFTVPAGAQVLSVRPKDPAKWRAMNIRAIKLTPAEAAK